MHRMEIDIKHMSNQSFGEQISTIEPYSVREARKSAVFPSVTKACSTYVHDAPKKHMEASRK